MKVRFRRHGEVVIIDLSGEIVGADGHVLRSAFGRAIESHDIGSSSRILASLDGVVIMDSSALGALVYANTHAEKSNGRFCVTGVNERIAELFALSQLDAVLRQFPDEAAAIQYLES